MQRAGRWLVMSTWLCLACGKDAAAPPAAPVSGPGTSDNSDENDGGVPPRTGGSGGVARAGSGGAAGVGGASAGTPMESCARVPVLQSDPDDTPSSTSTQTPNDFAVTRQVEVWTIDADCVTPKLILEFSDGTCSVPGSHQLSIAFDLNALADGSIHSGNNDIRADADSSGIQIRYTRPAPLSPAGSWGTCTGASGTLIFLNEPIPASAANFDGRYELTLTACDGTSQAPQLVVGSFKLSLHYGVQTFCPDWRL